MSVTDTKLFYQATWITSPPVHGAGGQNKIGQLHSDVSQIFPQTPQQPSLRKSMDIRDKGKIGLTGDPYFLIDGGWTPMAVLSIIKLEFQHTY